MRRKQTTRTSSSSAIPDDIGKIDKILADKYRLLEEGAPDLKWKSAEVKVKLAWQVVKGIELGEVSKDHLEAAVKTAEQRLSEALVILTNRDGNDGVHDEIAKYIKLKADLVKRRTESIKASGDYLTRGEYLEEIDASLVIITRAIDSRVHDRSLAAALKNDIAQGFARRRARPTDRRPSDETVDATDPGGVRGSDGELQAVGMAEDSLQPAG